MKTLEDFRAQAEALEQGVTGDWIQEAAIARVQVALLAAYEAGQADTLRDVQARGL